MKLLAGFLLAIALAAAAGLAVALSGVYNVAASEAHSDAGEWALSRVMRRSIEARAGDAPPPPFALGDAAVVEAGASLYDEHCQPCHGAPGREHAPFAEGLNPEPPEFEEGEEAHELTEWSTAELFWITKHGIKMTGMPAWTVSHDDREIWRIVGLLERLPELSAQEYARLVEAGAGHGHGHGGGGAAGAPGGQQAGGHAP